MEDFPPVVPQMTRRHLTAPMLVLQGVATWSRHRQMPKLCCRG
jgi:hypothetical protein